MTKAIRYVDMSIERPAHPLVGANHERIGASALEGIESPAVGVYRGGSEIEHHSYERGFTDFEAHMGMVFPEVRSLDSFIEGRIDKARKTNSDVVVVDLGAGVGNFTRQSLVDPAVLARSRNRLAGRTCSSQLKFYSVTDTTAASNHLRKTQFAEASKPGNEQIAAHEVQYSVTSSQTIKKLLEGLEEQSSDLIVASSFMQYLRPQVFERALQDIVDVLKPGGSFMAFGYATVAGRYLSIDDGYLEIDGPVEFKDPTKTDDELITGDELRAWGTSLLNDAQTTPEQFKSAIDYLQTTMLSSDFYAQPVLGDFRGVIRKRMHDRLAQGESPENLFALVLHTLLPTVEDSERIQKMKEVKDQIIDDVARKNAAVAVVQRKRIPNMEQGLDGILIKKRVDRSSQRKYGQNHV